MDGDLEAVDDERLRGYAALIVPAGMVSDRLRYTEDVTALAPAVRLLRRALMCSLPPATMRIRSFQARPTRPRMSAKVLTGPSFWTTTPLPYRWPR